ncbi:MAG: replicative DNA helicase, partial [Chloroflexi bacterium]|nr:replicative DNA helicase [Chloroflexota bacterium]
SRKRLLQIGTALKSEPLKQLAESDVYWDKITKIEFIGEHQVYDLTIPETHNFVADDMLVHNTSLMLNLGYNASFRHRQRVAIFSLEMGNEQLVQRFVSTETGIEGQRLRTGTLSDDEWGRMSQVCLQMSEMPMFLDDSPALSPLDLRVKARRIYQEHGLDLIIVDYLQLMQGDSKDGKGGGENRVQEISYISRSLKQIARELKVPLIAGSQLSRTVEQRSDKRPMLSDLRESGCLAGDTLVTLESGARVPIRELAGKSEFGVLALDQTTLKLKIANVSRAFCTGVKPIYEMVTRLGRRIKATANHKFCTIEGWQRLDHLVKGMRIALPRQIDCANNERTSSPSTSTSDDSDIYWDEIVSITSCGDEEVFDLTVPGPHNFVANDIFAHNSIEQDADIVSFIYRDEMYNPDTEFKNIAELIIAKNRNGPTGKVDLFFDKSLTAFRNLAREKVNIQ